MARATDGAGNAYALQLAVGDRVRLFARTRGVFAGPGGRGKSAAIGDNGSVLEVAEVRPSRGLVLRTAAGKEGFVAWEKLRDEGSGRVRLAYGDCLTIDSSQGLTSDEQVLPRIKEGYPITMIIPKEGIGYGMQGMAILAGTDRLPTVEKVVDLMGTEEFSKFLASSAGYTTRFPSAVPALYADGPPKYIPNIDLGWALSERDRILEEWTKRIGREAQ